MKFKEVINEEFKQLNELAPAPVPPAPAAGQQQQVKPIQQQQAKPAQQQAKPGQQKLLTPQELLGQLNTLTNSGLQVDQATLESLKKIIPAFLAVLNKTTPIQQPQK
jgi:hypothetical protein